MIFELPDNKHIGKLFLKCELLYLDQSNSSSNPFQVVNSLQNDRCSFIFIALPVHATTPTFPTKDFLQLISTSLFRPYLFIKPFLQFALTLSSSIPQQFFNPFFLCTAILSIYIKSIFPTSAI